MKSKELYDFIFNNIVGFVGGLEVESMTRLVLEKFFNCKIIDVLKNEEVNVKESIISNVVNNIKKRLCKHEPIQYIMGECGFLNCRILLDKNVFIPRQETEELVYNILRIDISNKKVLDVCSGSGCIGIAIKKNFKSSEVTCLDVDKNAILQAQKNAKLNDVDIRFINLDIFSPDVENIGDYDVIVSNPPYIPEADKYLLDKNILLYEPPIALFVEDDDPLKFYKRLKFMVDRNLNNRGKFFLEINENFANDILLLFTDEKFKNLKINNDLNCKCRWISGEKYE